MDTQVSMSTDKSEKSGKINTIFLLDAPDRPDLERLSSDTLAPIPELLRRSVSFYLQKEFQKGTNARPANL